MRVFSLIILVFYLFSCNPIGSSATKPNAGLTFLALGDSYTIGESVLESERWPNQLKSFLATRGLELNDPIIIAKTGWRTDQLIAATKSFDAKKKFDLVSLLIGVNNQFQGKEIEVYKEEFKKLLEMAIERCTSGKNGVFVLSIPDYGVTPFARDREPKRIAREIDLYNKIAGEICLQYDIEYIDITPISREAAKDTELIANDKLHPSGKMYALWAKSCAQFVMESAEEK